MYSSVSDDKLNDDRGGLCEERKSQGDLTEKGTDKNTGET